jgi:hypothetical protein
VIHRHGVKFVGALALQIAVDLELIGWSEGRGTFCVNYDEWVGRLRALVGSLEQLPGVKVSSSFLAKSDEEGLSFIEWQLTESARRRASGIDPPLREFYKATGGFELYWMQLDPPPPLMPFTGKCDLADIGRLYDPEEGEGPPGSHAEGYSVFDALGNTRMVLAGFEVGASEPRLYWYTTEGDGRERLCRLLINFDEYLEYGLAACFLDSWQLLFAEDAGLLPTTKEDEFFRRLGLLAPLGNEAALREAARNVRRGRSG